MEDIFVGKTKQGKDFYFDKEDFDLVKDYTWRSDKFGYIYTGIPLNGKIKTILMHRLIMNQTNPKIEIDHINGKENDNRKENLRSVTHQQNSMNKSLDKNNTSGHKGVHYCKSENKWKSYITFEGKRKNLGTFENLEEAVVARKEAEKKYYGEFAREL